ncbi:zinc/cadmium resistance protein [Notolabrus celidotus]|uniref:zinc/cadmium resistance protein n=1 Tax=Notolabrus celidotus TaxID=1203425 RepID=UPI00148FCC21|nr:zinc/cadmium resistance protein [Notolabrus celidotus]
MRVPHWCMLGVAILLLVCQVIIHQLCETLIVLADGFHTLFVIVRMAFPPPSPPVCLRKPPPSSVDSPATPAHSSTSSAAVPPTLHAEPCIEALPGTHTSTDGSPIQDQLSTPHPPLEGASLANSHQLFTPEVSPPALNCGLSFTHSRTPAVGAFISALVLTSLCLSYITEIVSYSVEPHPVQRPLLPVLVGAVSLLYKMLLLWLNWGQMEDTQPGVVRQSENKCHLEENHKVLTKEKAKGCTDPRRVLDDINQVHSDVDGCLHNGALILSNPGISSSIPNADSQTSQPQPGVHLHTAPPQVDRNCEDLSHSKDIAEVSIEDTCMEHLDSKNASRSSPVCEPSHHTEERELSSQGPACLLSSVLITQGLCSPLLTLINSLVTLLIDPLCPHSSEVCSFLVYLDPGLSLLAVITLIATAMPQLHSYGLLLLQSTPPHICVSDLGQRIASVPGVQAVHDLHVWQLSGSLTVASVHVHCHAGFPLHRCADLLSGVTKVLQSVGVSCCTVQPEFVSYAGCSAGSTGDASPVVHREDPTLPPLLLACSLACGKACTGNMCCSPPEEESRSMLTPPAGETKEEPQTLVIENTFL